MGKPRGSKRKTENAVSVPNGAFFECPNRRERVSAAGVPEQGRDHGVQRVPRTRTLTMER